MLLTALGGFLIGGGLALYNRERGMSVLMIFVGVVLIMMEPVQ